MAFDAAVLGDDDDDDEDEYLSPPPSHPYNHRQRLFGHQQQQQQIRHHIPAYHQHHHSNRYASTGAATADMLDGDRAFALSVAADLGRLTDEQRALAKVRIQQVLADSRYLPTHQQQSSFELKLS